MMVRSKAIRNMAIRDVIVKSVIVERDCFSNVSSLALRVSEVPVFAPPSWMSRDVFWGAVPEGSSAITWSPAGCETIVY